MGKYFSLPIFGSLVAFALLLFLFMKYGNSAPAVPTTGTAAVTTT